MYYRCSYLSCNVSVTVTCLLERISTRLLKVFYLHLALLNIINLSLVIVYLPNSFLSSYNWTAPKKNPKKQMISSLHLMTELSRIEFKNPCPPLQSHSSSDFNKFIVPNNPTRTLCSQDAELEVMPKISKCKMGGRAFSNLAPLLWNHLQVLVQESDTLSAFKSELKTFLFDKVYN